MAAEADRLSLRSRKKLEARQQILAGAARLIRDQGYVDTTMRDVARTAGLSYQTLYNYFPTKGEILRTLLSAEVTDLGRRYDTLLSGWAGTLPDGLDALNTLSFATVAEGDRTLWRIATLECLQQSDDAPRAFRLIGEPTRDLHRDLQRRLLVLARNRGELDDDAHLPMLGDVLFDLTDYALLRFLLSPRQPMESALAALDDQIRGVLSPYLTDRPATGLT